MGICRFLGANRQKWLFWKKSSRFYFFTWNVSRKSLPALSLKLDPKNVLFTPTPITSLLPPQPPSFLLTRGRGKIGVSSNSRRVVIFWCHFMWKNKIRNSFRKKIIFGGLHPQTAKYQFWPENQLFLRTLYLLYSHEMLSLCWPYLIHHNFNVFSVQF